MTSNFAARNSWERDGRISDSTRLAPSGNADAPPRTQLYRSVDQLRGRPWLEPLLTQPVEALGFLDRDVVRLGRKASGRAVASWRRW
jgi:hypothetical protein